MNTRKVLLSLLALFTLHSVARANLVYMLEEYPLTDGYGFSGTITTDGSIGDFGDTSPIIDWNITLSTPGDVDLVTAQTYTPANSVFTGLFSSPKLQVTGTEILLLEVDSSTNGSNFLEVSSSQFDSFGTRESFIQYRTLSFVPTNALRSSVAVVDNSELVGFSEVVFPGTEPLLVATLRTVPEPSAFLTTGLLAMVCAVRRPRSRVV